MQRNMESHSRKLGTCSLMTMLSSSWTLVETMGEDRYIRVGSIGGSVLVVAVAYTERGHRFRIISAMPAPKALRKLYEDGY